MSFKCEAGGRYYATQVTGPQRNWMKRLVATSRGDIMLHTLCGTRPLEGVKTSHELYRHRLAQELKSGLHPDRGRRTDRAPHQDRPGEL